MVTALFISMPGGYTDYRPTASQNYFKTHGSNPATTIPATTGRLD